MKCNECSTPGAQRRSLSGTSIEKSLEEKVCIQGTYCKLVVPFAFFQLLEIYFFSALGKLFSLWSFRDLRVSS